MKVMDIKINMGWKALVYFDFVLPLLLFLIALLFPVSGIRSLFALLFHSYNMYVVKTIPDFVSFTGIVGFLYHLGVIGYTLKKKSYRDMLLCLLITALITVIFITGINYEMVKPLSFNSL